jgi:chitinase
VGTDNRLAIIHPDAALEVVYPGDCAEAGCPHGLFHQITLVKQRYPHLKFLMSVGGWTDSAGFYEMAATDDGRRTFARSCADFLRTYPQFDGIDIDWEHPVVGGLQRALGQPRDAHNYVLLLSEIRRAIGADHLLTIAAGAGPNAIAPLEYADMTASLDWVAVMTYDFHTGGPRTGYNSPLYDHGDPDNPRHNLNEAVQSILAKGVPRTKLAAGVPFYGHGWAGVESSGVWSAATGTAPSGNYRKLAAEFINMNGYVRFWDDVAKVPWLYNAARKEWISYDDPESMRIKGQYIAAQQLNGAMFWELSGDDGSLIDALVGGMGQ